MKNRENDNEFAKEGNEQFVIADNGNPLVKKALRLMSREVALERIAILGQINAPEDKRAKSESPASELWREMPELAREYEAHREDDGLPAEDSPVVDDWEFDEFGGVTA